MDLASVKLRVQQELSKIEPLIARDGGAVELVEVTDLGVVKIRLLGACVGCPASEFTVKLGIEEALCAAIREVTSVEAVD